MYIIWQIAIGILAGWLAGKIMRGRGYGLILDLALGIIGSILGGILFRALGLMSTGLLGSLVVATAGAVLLIWIVRQIR